MSTNVNFHKKEDFETLCLNINIPKRPPTAPPTKLKASKSFSGILLLFFIAKNLSTPNNVKVKILIQIR